MTERNTATTPEGFVLNERALFRLIDDEAVILKLDSGHYLGLNAVATRIWSLLAEGHVLPEIEAALAEEFEVDEVTATNDIASFLQELQDAGLLARDEASDVHKA
jgi:hypothetical protein